MRDARTSRRTLLRALVSAPVGAALVGLPAMAATASGDSALLSAWEEYKALQRLNYATPGDAWNDEQEEEFYRQLDAVEIVLERAEAKTPRGAAAQILLSMMHFEGSRQFCEGIINGVTMPANYDDLDWMTKLAVRAADALWKMGA
ncbi:MAG TPA: hypothetical protein VGF77_13335 [Allosphingosinicella sp.]|jgi:hypothetical protein